MDVDQEILADVVTRLRRVQGQLGGVITMLEEGRGCEPALTQLAAASRALDRAGFRLLASGLEQCMAAERDGSTTARLDRDRLEKLFLALA
jgi:DNA-binding FrmR family transcriptional regulator